MKYSIGGNQVCCVASNFVDLQTSPAGFGDSLREAFIDYWKGIGEKPRKVDLKRWERPWVDEL